MSFIKELEGILGKQTDILQDNDVKKKPIYVSKDNQAFDAIFLTNSRKSTIKINDVDKSLFTTLCIIKDVYQSIMYEKRVLSYMSKGIYSKINEFKPLEGKKLNITTHTLDSEGYNRNADVKELELSEFDKNLIETFKKELKNQTK